MASSLDVAGEPIPTSAVLMSASKHIATRCRGENVAFLKCKKDDPNPEKCLEKGRQVTSCVLFLLKDLHQKCIKEMDTYAGCMYYNTDEFELCRKEQKDFEKACPLNCLGRFLYFTSLIIILFGLPCTVFLCKLMRCYLQAMFII